MTHLQISSDVLLTAFVSLVTAVIGVLATSYNHRRAERKRAQRLVEQQKHETRIASIQLHEQKQQARNEALIRINAKLGRLRLVFSREMVIHIGDGNDDKQSACSELQKACFDGLYELEDVFALSETNFLDMRQSHKELRSQMRIFAMAAPSWVLSKSQEHFVTYTKAADKISNLIDNEMERFSDLLIGADTNLEQADP